MTQNSRNVIFNVRKVLGDTMGGVDQILDQLTEESPELEEVRQAFGQETLDLVVQKTQKLKQDLEEALNQARAMAEKLNTKS